MQANESFCSECSKEFKDGEQVIKAGAQKFCEKCFQCSMCNSSMCPEKYVEKANKRYCLSCYENKAAKKCSKCFKV
ncbi:four and a half LIM domains protein 3-like [Brevipalpus obovatus]|uniref:four and a half LIM domains protein 3-like n=1 Tax=Brevipalpus obovatus TaxID=246614 RepID=UPI003D9E1535